MKNLLRKIQAALTATAFAEEGEVDEARRILAEAGVHGRTARRGGLLESTMSAAAFAEEGDADTARRLLGDGPPPPPAKPEVRPAEAPPASRPARPRILG
jgi:hypothetical protein